MAYTLGTNSKDSTSFEMCALKAQKHNAIMTGPPPR